MRLHLYLGMSGSIRVVESEWIGRQFSAACRRLGIQFTVSRSNIIVDPACLNLTFPIFHREGAHALWSRKMRGGGQLRLAFLIDRPMEVFTNLKDQYVNDMEIGYALELLSLADLVIGMDLDAFTAGFRWTTKNFVTVPYGIDPQWLDRRRFEDDQKDIDFLLVEPTRIDLGDTPFAKEAKHHKHSVASLPTFSAEYIWRDAAERSRIAVDVPENPTRSGFPSARIHYLIGQGVPVISGDREGVEAHGWRGIVETATPHSLFTTARRLLAAGNLEARGSEARLAAIERRAPERILTDLLSHPAVADMWHYGVSASVDPPRKFRDAPRNDKPHDPRS